MNSFLNPEMSRRHERSNRDRHSPAGARLSTSTWVMLSFIAFVFLLGGGSRSDVVSLPWLRGGALLFAFWAASQMKQADWHRIRVPLVLLLGLIAWMGLQLVPLPPGIWHSLPGREVIVEIDHLLNQPDLWRPLSLAPSQTLNALLAMTVPLAGLLLAASVPSDEYFDVMLGLVAVACVSALLGLVQIISGATSPAYLYRITNQGDMVGLFANRNHHAVFLACVTLLVAALLRDEFMRKRKRVALVGGLLFAGVLLTSMTVFIGSRAGFASGVVAFAIGYVMIVRAWRSEPSGRSVSREGTGGKRLPSPARRVLLFAPPILLLSFFGAALWLTDRTTALSRLTEKDVADDLRVQAWSTVQAMIDTYWVWGGGFGSFQGLYRVFEPDALLQQAYFNHAHNDWAELLITGGLPFALVALATLLWFGLAFVRGGTSNLVKGHRGDVRLPILVIVLILGGASLVDYPLRVPSLQVMAIALILFLCCPKPMITSRDSA